MFVKKEFLMLPIPILFPFLFNFFVVLFCFLARQFARENIGVNVIVLRLVVVACMADSREFASKGDSPTKLVKGRKAKRKTLTTSVGCAVST